MMKMKRMIFALVVCALFGASVMAAPTGLGWQRGDAGTTYQVWTFDNADNPAAPEIDENPYGAPLAEMVNGAAPTDIPAYFAFGYYDKYLGRSGVWSGDPLEIGLYIPNREASSDWKEIWLEIGWRGEALGRLNGHVGSVLSLLRRRQVRRHRSPWVPSPCHNRRGTAAVFLAHHWRS